MSIVLKKENLKELEKKSVKVPQYEQKDLKAGIVHFGVGNFHRAHQAVYLNDLFNQGVDHDWAIIGAGNRENDSIIKAKLKEQNYLFSVVEQDANKNEAEIVASVIDYLVVDDNDDNDDIVDTLSNETIKIVSLTITEGGYYIDSSTGLFDEKNKDIQYDASNINTPNTVFGYILAALINRREKGIAPFTVMSCDNIPHNGNVTKNTLYGLAKLIDEKLADWVLENVAFPNGMVDRITPATTQRELNLIDELCELEDQVPVFCESFKQWVLEDKFPSGRPALEKVGVEFVEDVTPYENMKIRILNGGHASIAYLASLLDIEFAHEAMKNPLVLGFFQKLQENEIIPILPPVPNTDLFEYYKKIEERFSNPKIADTTLRLCYDGSNRQPKFIIPTIADCLDKGNSIKGLALASALWCRYCYGETPNGDIIKANDPNWEKLTKVAKDAKINPILWLEMEDIYGKIGNSKVFKEEFTNMLNSIWSQGIEKTIEAYINN